MLSKAVCKRCWGKGNWTVGDESRWVGKEKFVLCPVPPESYVSTGVRVKNPPPDWCPRKMEHGVASVVETADAE